MNIDQPDGGEDATVREPSVYRNGRVAIIHYWLVGMRGGERVLERLLKLFPQADIFTHVYVPEAVSELIRSRKVTTSFIQRLPRAATWYKRYLPLMPRALEELDLSGYDLVISSESGPAKGVLAPPDAFHICYCHSPMRYIWDHYSDYKRSAGHATRLMMPIFSTGLRTWDTASAARVDRIVANSTFIQRRIRRSWGREADVIHPPIDIEQFQPSASPEDYYLWVGQMTAYKRPDIALNAFNRLKLPLIMIGDGELRARLSREAGPNIKILPKVDFATLKRTYANCKALVFTAEEDFGIVPVEVNASGRPVLAYGKGGARDSIVADRTGLFFGEQSTDSLSDGVERLNKWLPSFDPQAAVAHAKRFAPPRFDEAFLRLLPA